MATPTIDYEAHFARKIGEFFPDEEHRAEAIRRLAGYGEDEASRVRLAILKLAGADLDAIEFRVAEARKDFRDTLAAAEFPHQSRAMDEETATEAINRLIERDRREYETWLHAAPGGTS